MYLFFEDGVDDLSKFIFRVISICNLVWCNVVVVVSILISCGVCVLGSYIVLVVLLLEIDVCVFFIDLLLFDL